MSTAFAPTYSQNWERESKTIKFSSSVYSAIENIPSVILAVVLYPFLAIFVAPLLNFMLWRTLQSIRKTVPVFKTAIKRTSYDNAKQHYTMLSMLVMLVDILVKTPDVSSLNVFVRVLIMGIYKKAITISTLLLEMKDAAAQTLFVSIGKQEPLSEQEKEAYKILNEVWGDDKDEVYARFTHAHLTKIA